ncbi:MAG: glycosyltransferase [Chloroflexota bacterium]
MGGGAAEANLHRPQDAAESTHYEEHDQLLWIGAVGGMEQALVEHAKVCFQAIETGQLRGINPLKAAGNLLRMGQGFAQAHRLVRSFQPDVCFVTGGYVCVPVALACRLRGVPILTYLPDMNPGMAILIVSKLAQRVAVTFEEVAHFFGGLYPDGKSVITGYPVRQELIRAAGDRQNARRQLFNSLHQLYLAHQESAQLDSEHQESVHQESAQPETEREATPVKTDEKFSDDGLPLLLIWGGSQGARSINCATWHELEKLLTVAHVLHVVGTRDWPLFTKEYQASLSSFSAQSYSVPLQKDQNIKGRYWPVAYLNEEMSLALAAADLTVCRAGASTLGEFPVSRLPSILVPLPYQGVGQMHNAQKLARHDGAMIVKDEELKSKLAPTILELLGNPDRLSDMRQRLAAIAEPNAAFNIASQLAQMARG